MTAMVTRNEHAVATVDDGEFSRQLEPNTPEALFKMCIAVHKSGICKVQSPEDALVRIMAGRGMAKPMSMMQSLLAFYVVDGMPSLSAKAKHAICLGRPDICEEFRLIESNNDHATFRVKRAGEPAKDFTFTMEDAKLSGKVKPGGAWITSPRRMLEARAKGHAADVVFPDLVGGYATREDMEDERVQVTQVQPSESIAEMVPPVVVPVDVPARDLDAELGSLKEDIANAKTKEAKAEIRKRVAAFVADVGGTHADEAKHFYNMIHAPKAEPEAAPETKTTREPGED